VCAAVEQVLAFQIQLDPVPVAEIVRPLERGRPAAEVPDTPAELVHEPVFVLEDVSLIGIVELLDRRHQCLRHVLSTV